MPSSPILPPAGTLRRRLLAAAGATVAGSALPVLPALAQSGAPAVPAGYPDDYEQTIARGQREGAVTVYATTDLDIVRPLIQAFEARYPGIKVHYEDLNSLALNDRFLAESARAPGAGGADVLWSAAMDLQVKLVNDGHAQRYESPERGGLPARAVWRDEAWGTTFEPAVIVYNRRHLAGVRLPRSRSGLARLLQDKAPGWRGRVVTYDVEKSGVGYLLAQQDARMGSEFWYLAQALGRSRVQLQASTAGMIERIASGELVLGYNLLGAYALSLMERGADIDVIAPRDYTLVISRVAFIARRAPHPNAARLWLDFLLSGEGQGLLGRSSSQLYTVRTDTENPYNATALAERLGYALKPIGLGPGLLAAQDAMRKRAFLARWRAALAG
ncbi:iron ABC transporter substrate-binding protein [Cupriavidus sp. USMAA2-4]|uniref:ABC transporter substrate-binding protein n=1 Tax=Cupriavidus sp. USMAA2-4 TaxID=876364 RepID=UPI0008A6ADB9|nr:ABC transporter substrate-binding protein [Cupriavidus sp. USMAA2-4]AOY92260.1 iron ABC transporter substrate-binding protein [Cupriavidus sp. USMAA2-4]